MNQTGICIGERYDIHAGGGLVTQIEVKDVKGEKITLQGWEGTPVFAMTMAAFLRAYAEAHR